MTMCLSNVKAVLGHDASVRQYLNQLDRNQMVHLDGEIYGELYWLKRNPQWFKDQKKQVFARLRWVQRLVKKRLATNRVKPELTANGLEVSRSHHLGNIYCFERYRLRAEGWELQYQEADYSAFWANKQTLQLCTYCEGDVVMKSAADMASFMSEYIETQAWYSEHG